MENNLELQDQPQTENQVSNWLNLIEPSFHLWGTWIGVKVEVTSYVDLVHYVLILTTAKNLDDYPKRKTKKENAKNLQRSQQL